MSGTNTQFTMQNAQFEIKGYPRFIAAMGQLRNISLMSLTMCAIIQTGAQLFALSIIARTVSKAPPRSFAILTGEYAYDSRPFSDIVPMITLFLFLTALAANWK